MLKKISKYFNKDGQKAIKEFAKHFQQLNQCIVNDDKRCAANIIAKFIEISEIINLESTNKSFLMACAGYPTDVCIMRKVHHSLIIGRNATTLEILHGYLKPMANQMNQIIKSCENGRCKHSFP